MKTFTIEKESDNITAHLTIQAAEAVAGAERFRNEAGLAQLAANWPATRLIEIWHSLPGATPVKKFKDRKTAVTRIWKAIQSLAEAVPMEATRQHEIASVTIETAPAELEGETLVPEAFREPEAALPAPQSPQKADVAPAKAPANRKASRSKKSPTAATRAIASRGGSKTATVLGLLKREGGVTSKELMSVTGWQAHSLRGFISGTVSKKMGLTVVSVKAENGERTYSISV